MMKIALMTWFSYDNYGTALQVTALSHELSKEDNEVFLVNYLPSGRVVKIPKKKTLKSFSDRIYRKIRRLLGKKRISSKNYTSKEREQLFENFRNENLRFTDKCVTLSDLEKLNLKYDAFVCGSDQIWAPSCFDSHYFLDFVRDERKLIAYAPSIGLPSVENADISSEMKKLINRFSHLSVREEAGAKLIQELTGKKSEVVLDPTLLKDKDFWGEKAKSGRINLDEKYLLTYFLGKNESHWEKTYKLAEKLGLKLAVIPVFDVDLKREGCLKEAVGPNEFLSLIKNAQYMCTDSFHGVLFSLIFNRNFCVFERFKKSEANNQNSRIYNILSITGLNNRLFKNKITDELLKDINYSFVEEKIKVARENSKRYLNDALSAVGNNKESQNKNHIFKNNSLCCGCGVCEKVCPVGAITIKMNENGFYCANVDENKCISCGKCVNSCPMQTDLNSVSINDGKLFSYKDNSDKVLLVSSSGGFAYSLSKTLIEKGYCVAGCTFDKKEQIAKHILITPQNKDDLSLIQGSKYIQSKFSDVLPKLQNCETPIAVFGTPCQISAAKKYFEKRTDILYVDLICHGVPSYSVFWKYLEYEKKKNGINMKETSVDFRCKSKGWHEKHMMVFDDEKSICKGMQEDYFIRMFERGHCYMESCYDCRWRDKSQADIRIGDYWGSKFKDDKTGVSMIVSFNETGDLMLKELEKANCGILKEEPIDDYLVQQTFNFPKPVFYNRLINDLKNKKISVKTIVENYSAPFENKNRHHKLLIRIKNLIKGR